MKHCTGASGNTTEAKTGHWQSSIGVNQRIIPKYNELYIEAEMCRMHRI